MIFLPMKRSSKYQYSKYNQRRTVSAPFAQTSEKSWRFYFIQVMLFLVCGVLIVRLIQIQILEHAKYHQLAEDQYLREYVQKAQRGRIYDRNRVTLALNQPCYDLGLDTHFVTDPERTAEKIARILNIPARSIYERIRAAKNFVYLKRKISEEKAAILQESAIPGLKVIKMSERIYPLKEKVAQVVGFVNIDGNGLSGVELKMNDDLKGRDGWSIQQKDALGKSILPVQATTRTCENGHDIELTIDNVIQTIVEEELQKSVEHFNAKSGSIVVTNPMTGEILAMASVPSFDPNRTAPSDSASWRIRSITDIFEPGSTFKLVTLLAALQDSLKSVNDIIFCENGHYKLFGETIKDSEEHGWLTVRNIVKYSSNIGIAKIALEVGKERLFRTARSFGFGLKTGIELPGEVSGILKKPAQWSAFSLAAMAYGHEIAVTSLQMAMAYGAVANGGKLMKPAIVKRIIDQNGKVMFQFRPQVVRQVMQPRLAQTITTILEDVVEDGTGTRAKIENHRIAGKTGTAQKPRPGGGYSNSRYVASFAGYYPADQPQYLMFINIDEPHPTHSGGSVAAPTFKRILQRILDVYGQSPPDTEMTFTHLQELPELEGTPDLKGRNVETAIRLLNERNVHFKIIGTGLVVKSQESKVQEDGKEFVVLHTGVFPAKQTFQTMPNLLRLPLRQAVSACAVLGLKVRIFGSGEVVAQKPSAGSKIKTGAQCMLECRPKRRLNLLGSLSPDKRHFSEN